MKLPTPPPPPPSKERYDAFMAEWGDARADRNRSICKNDPAMREITADTECPA